MYSGRLQGGTDCFGRSREYAAGFTNAGKVVGRTPPARRVTMIQKGSGVVLYSFSMNRLKTEET